MRLGHHGTGNMSAPPENAYGCVCLYCICSGCVDCVDVCLCVRPLDMAIRASTWLPQQISLPREVSHVFTIGRCCWAAAYTFQCTLDEYFALDEHIGGAGNGNGGVQRFGTTRAAAAAVAAASVSRVYNKDNLENKLATDKCCCASAVHNIMLWLREYVYTVLYWCVCELV